MPCTPDELMEASKCYQVLSESEQMAAIIYYLCLAQICLGDADCDAMTIVEDSACIKYVPKEQRLAMDVYNAFQIADNAGAPVTGTIDEVATGIACLKSIPLDTLDALRTLYTCRVSACVAAPIT